MTADELCRTEWLDLSQTHRLRFRRDGSGYYEREATGGARFVHENFLFRVEGSELALKFAHAREWTRVGARVEENRLTLERDAYAAALEERETGEVVLAAHAGVALPSE